MAGFSLDRMRVEDVGLNPQRLAEAIHQQLACNSGPVPVREIALALDTASSEFFKNNKYVFHKSDNSSKSAEDMVKLFEKSDRSDVSRPVPDRRPIESVR